MLKRLHPPRPLATFATAAVLVASIFKFGCEAEPNPIPHSPPPVYHHVPNFPDHDYGFDHIVEPERFHVPKIPEQNQTPPVGEPLNRQNSQITPEVISDIKARWESGEKLTTLPDSVAIVVNVALRNAYGVDIPDGIAVKFLSDDAYSSFFGESAAYFYSGTKTIYLREQPVTAGLFGGLYHELGHVLDVYVFKFPIEEARGREHTAWFVHKDLLWETECLLPKIGDNVLTIFPEGFSTPFGITHILFSTLTSSLSPYFTLYPYDVVAGIWETRKMVQEGKADANTIAGLSSWMVLGMSYDLNLARLAISRYTKEQLNKLATNPISDDDFFLLVDNIRLQIQARLEACEYGNKLQGTAISNFAYCVSTLKALMALWDQENANAVGLNDGICGTYTTDAVLYHCYDCPY